MRKKPRNWMALATMVPLASEAARKHVIGMDLSRVEKAQLPVCVQVVISDLPRSTQQYRSAYLDYPLSKPVRVQQEKPERVKDFQRVMRMLAALAGPGALLVERMERAQGGRLTDAQGRMLAAFLLGEQRHAANDPDAGIVTELLTPEDVVAMAKASRPSVPTLYRWEQDFRVGLEKEMPGTLQPTEKRPTGTRPRHKRRPATPPASFPVCDVPSERLPNTNLTRRPIGPECWGEDWDNEWVLVTAPRKYAKHLRVVGGRWNRAQLGWFVERQQMVPLIEALTRAQRAEAEPLYEEWKAQQRARGEQAEVDGLRWQYRTDEINERSRRVAEAFPQQQREDWVAAVQAAIDEVRGSRYDVLIPELEAAITIARDHPPGDTSVLLDAARFREIFERQKRIVDGPAGHGACVDGVEPAARPSAAPA